jgi:hypothetical protein
MLPATSVLAQEGVFIVGDALPDAPELAPRGTYKTGVRTVDVVNKSQIDILKANNGTEPLYDRSLKLEIWYPAQVKPGSAEVVIYESVLGRANDPKRPLIPFTFTGRAFGMLHQYLQRVLFLWLLFHTATPVPGCYSPI